MVDTKWIVTHELVPELAIPTPGMIVCCDYKARDRYLLVHIEPGADSWGVVNMDGRVSLWEIDFATLINWLNNNGMGEL